MMEYDIRLIDSTYTTDRHTGDVTVKLFGRTRDDRSVTVLCPDYKPYFHVYDPPPELRAQFRRHPDVLNMEDILLEYKGAKEKFLKVTVAAPWQVRSMRNDYELHHRNLHLYNLPAETRQALRAERGVVEVAERGVQTDVYVEDRVYSQRIVQEHGLLRYMNEDRDSWYSKAVFFSADLVFTNRYIYDNDLESCVRATGDETAGTGTDLTVRAKSFDRCPIFTPKLRILSLDIEQSIRFKHLYCVCLSVLNQPTNEWAGLRIVSQWTPTKQYAKGEPLTPGDKQRQDADQRRMLIELVTSIQTIDPDVITGYFINSFDLQVIYDLAARLFGTDKEKVKELALGRDGTTIQKRLNRTTGFVTWDVKGRLVLDAWLHAKKEVRPKREGLGFVASLLFGEDKDNIDSSRIDDEWTARKDEVVAYCLKDAELALKILVHPKVNAINKLMDVAIPAKLPCKEVGGGQNRMIESLLIRMADREGVAVPSGGSETIKDYEGGFNYDAKAGLWDWVVGVDFSAMYPSQIKKHNICFTTFTKNPGPRDHASPIGGGFVSKEVRHGIVPRMVQNFLDGRKEAKKQMKKAREEGDLERAEYYDRLQQAIKVMANATYGYFGTKFCRWPYNEYIAPSITAWAREDITHVVKSLESQGLTVIYGDTDSVFFHSDQAVDVEACKLLGKKVQDEFSTGELSLELEKVMSRFFCHAKKRYFGKIVWPSESLLVRGYEPRRTDSFDLQSDAMTQVFNLVLEGKPSEALEYAKETVYDVKKGRVDVMTLVQSKSVNEYDTYVNPDSLVHVNVARELEQRGYEFTPGSKVPFIVTNARVSPQRAEPIIEGLQFTARPDYEYYAQRLARSLARITEAFNCDEKALLDGNAQKGLDAFGVL